MTFRTFLAYFKYFTGMIYFLKRMEPYIIRKEFLGARAGFTFQSFCLGERQKGFPLQSLAQNQAG